MSEDTFSVTQCRIFFERIYHDEGVLIRGYAGRKFLDVPIAYLTIYGHVVESLWFHLHNIIFPQVILYEPHTVEKSLSGDVEVKVTSRYCLTMAGQVRDLLHVLLPPHQRVCVKGHLLHSRVGIELGLHMSTSTSMDVLSPKRSLKSLG